MTPKGLEVSCISVSLLKECLLEPASAYMQALHMVLFRHMPIFIIGCWSV